MWKHPLVSKKMEELGLEPDLKNQRLRVLPMNEEQTYLMV